MPTRNLSIMFTDIQGFTQRTSASTRDAMNKMMSKHAQLLIPVFHYFDGTIVKTIGDAFLVYFPSPTDAVLCGVTIQEVLRQHNDGKPTDERLDVRVAINVGDVELVDGDIMGEPVNIAARLEGIAEAGEVYFTEAVYQTMNRREAPSAEVGEKTFKGIPHPIRVFKVIDEPGSDLAERLSKSVSLTNDGPLIEGIRDQLLSAEETDTRPRKWWLAAAAAVIAVVVFLAYPSQRDQQLSDARALAAQRNYINALALINTTIIANPADTELQADALEYARSHLNALVEKELADKALEWLRDALTKHAYLDSLRPQVAVLDARIVVKQSIRGNSFVPFYELADRYPNDTEGLYTAAQLLEGKFFTYMPVWLYHKVLERGAYNDNQHIFDYCVKVFNVMQHYTSLELCHNIHERYFTGEATAWSLNALESGSAAEVHHAHQTLVNLKHAEANSTYYTALKNLVEGKQLEEAMQVFASETNQKRREHILALHQEVADKYPRFFMAENTKNEILENKQKLAASWQ